MQIAQKDEAILTLRAQELSLAELNSAWLQTLLDEMQSTMLAKQGVGIAAPQVYVSRRIIIVASHPNARYPDAPEMPAVAMINPEIIHRSCETLWGEEGCLSVPFERGQVARAATIQVRYIDRNGQQQMNTYSGFPARIVQHEVDHLDGILFTQYL